jgi:hypothetical protein
MRIPANPAAAPGPQRRLPGSPHAAAAGDNFGIEVTEDTSPMALGLDLEAEIFRSYDIRGITTSNLTEEVVYWIGRAFAAEALDIRISGAWRWAATAGIPARRCATP